VTRRLETARVELASSQAALKYRYVVIAEPERPRKPMSPNRILFSLAAVLGAVVMGALSGAVRDLLSGLVYEPWQIKSLGLQVVGEVKLTKDNR